MRTFLAIEIPKHIRAKVNNLIVDEMARVLPIKWVKFENLHITLKFLGEIDEKKKDEIIAMAKETAIKFQPFDMNLEDLGCFPGAKNPRVLWLGVKTGAETLSKMANEIEEVFVRLGFKNEKRFHPHLTIGRIKKMCKVDDILSRNFKTESFTIKAFTFFKSTLRPQGPIYEQLQKFSLG